MSEVLSCILLVKRINLCHYPHIPFHRDRSTPTEFKSSTTYSSSLRRQLFMPALSLPAHSFHCDRSTPAEPAPVHNFFFYK